MSDQPEVIDVDSAPVVALLPAPLPSNAPKVPVVMGERGLRLQSLEECWRFAQFAARSGLVPKCFVNKPEAVLTAIQLGAEVGLSPMAAVQNIAVIGGKGSLYGDAQLALVRQSPLWIEEVFSETFAGQGEDLAAVCTVQRRGMTKPWTVTFSVADAKRAYLWGKEGPWQTYPKRMLMWRARGWALRDCFSDVLKGLSVSAEELIDAGEGRALPAAERPPRQSLTARVQAEARAGRSQAA